MRRVIRVIEAAYADVSNISTWLRNIHSAAAQFLDAGHGIQVYCYDFDLLTRPRLISSVDNTINDNFRQSLEQAISEAPLELLRLSHGTSLVMSLSEVIGGGLDLVPYLHRHFSPISAVDAIGINHVTTGGLAVALAAPQPKPTTPSSAFRLLWSRVATHIGAGLRLCMDGDGSAHSQEAVLDLSGKLHHATGAAESREARIALRQAARAIDRSRAARFLSDSEAVETWRVLVDGRWSLVEQFESGGRHLLVARRNPIRVGTTTSNLSERELQVLALAALGRTNKLIAYELGLATGTVGTLLMRAGRKLGVSSRAQLINEWHRMRTEEVSNHGDT